MLGAKISAVPPEFRTSPLTHKSMRFADNGATVEAYSLKFRFALESPFTVPFYTALSPSAARFDNPILGYYSFS